MKRKTNVEIVTEVMESHPLAQAMIIEAITKYVDEVAKLDPENVEPNGFVNMHAWCDIAKDIKRRLDKHYE